ncbi:hypothetical protein [Colwellia sp. Bg11-28]|uniref:hypothetical protein n=1 Tax=Colwellia sp. Bg11-28 TaxID=2058305 RepID=UPI000C333B68|nr:hypothetical protein [Colwellia sp. Bg11-28]PKH85437.1 hypothetical protein CXF79_19430 [Colwellia sp. Bg11-28]
MIDFEYIQRKTIIVSLQDLAQKEFLHPELLRLYLPNSDKKKPLDLGALAYSKRKYVHGALSFEQTGYFVVQESFIKSRRFFLNNFIDYIITGGYRESSVSALISKVRKAFNIIEKYDFSEVFLKNIENSSSVYTDITLELKHKVHINEVTPRHAELIQVSVAFIILIGHGKMDFDHIVENNIKFRGGGNPTQPRDIVEFRYGYETYKSIALGLTTSLLKGDKLPILLKMPGYKTYLFPYANHRITPYCHRPTDAYNHVEGRLVTPEEYYAKRPLKFKWELNENLKRSSSYLEDANENMRAKCRRAFASTAMQSFQMIFMMITGSYVSEMNNIDFDGAFETTKPVIQKSYRIVKFRANGREVQYDLAHGAVNFFKHYLKLREWVLDGISFDKLFFGLETKSWNPCYVSSSAIRSFQRNKVIGIFMPSDFEMLTSRQFRKTKSLFLHEQPEVTKETVAQVLGHSDKTNEAHYMEVSPDKAQSEFANFWDAAHEAVSHISFDAKVADKGHTCIASGHCVEYKKPEPAIDSPPIQPDCRTQYGCLFCMHYICHANDVDDVHKLFSLLYIITGVLNATADTEKARELLLMLSSRVRQILIQVKMKSEIGKENVDVYRDKVFKHGELTPYWENRLQRYESLGIIFTEKQVGDYFEF